MKHGSAKEALGDRNLETCRTFMCGGEKDDQECPEMKGEGEREKMRAENTAYKSDRPKQKAHLRVGSSAEKKRNLPGGQSHEL